MLPLPEAVDDYVGPDNPVSFIEPSWLSAVLRRKMVNGSLVGHVRWPLQRVEPSAGLSKEERGRNKVCSYRHAKV